MSRRRPFPAHKVLERFCETHSHRGDAGSLYDQVELRLDWLEGPERGFMEVALREGIPLARLAEMAGVGADTARRRLHRLTERLLGDDYTRIRRNEASFSREERMAAYDHFLLGMGYRRIAVKRGLTPSQARRVLDHLRRWLANNRRQEENLAKTNHKWTRRNPNCF